jgi:NADH-quinone oxidoreductase subunit L
MIMPQLALIPAFPLAAFAILILAGRHLGRWSAWLAIVALAAALGLTLTIWHAPFAGQPLIFQWTWLIGSQPWLLGLRVDGLSWIMLVVVTSIGSLIACYSTGYMHGDPRYSRFFAYFSLFCAAMLGLALADNLLLLFICWELMGLCSYLLISFWFEKPSAAAAGRKAFLTTRVGDVGLFAGILCLAWVPHGSLQFAALPVVAQQVATPTLTLISLLIFMGAVGKSAQFPLHVWLPDAMEGPTPVSALIHAATMVAAGVYLIARTFPLFTPASLHVVLTIGLITHVFAGTIALTMTDIKRVLAYSTLSQLGLMVVAMGIGAWPAAMFHLVTHAYFKALLFLAAGSVIHATHEQELSKLGGLARTMPITSTVFLIASLSMSGLVGLSGFWSKDAILLAARHYAPWLFWVLLGGAGMTTAYIARLYLRCFYGAAAPHHGHAPHESPAIMSLPLVALAVGAALVGWIGSPGFSPFFTLLGVHEAHGFDLPVAALSTLALAVGSTVAWIVGFRRRNLLPAFLRPAGLALYRLAAHKYYVDELYQRLLIHPVWALGGLLSTFDRVVVDGAVNGSGRVGAWASEVQAWIDREILDRCVNAIGTTTRGLGRVMRWIQTGMVQHYLLMAVIAVVVLAVTVR